MTYCIDFFRKFKKDGNFCGLDKSEVSRLNAYLDIVELLMKQKIPEEQIYDKFSVNAARPLLGVKGDERTEGLNYITAALKNGKQVTRDEVQRTLKSWSTPTSHDDTDDGKLEYSNLPREQNSDPEPKKQNPLKCFSPQPGTIETPETSSVQTLRERIMAGEEVRGPPIIDASAAKEDPPAQKPIERPAWSVQLCKAGMCPDGINHYQMHKARKRMECELLNVDAPNISRCPILKAPPAFTRATGLSEDQPLTAGTHYPLLSKEEWPAATSDFIEGCLREKYHRIIAENIEENPRKYPTPLDVVCAGLEKMELQDGA